jgi:hypothetical protein
LPANHAANELNLYLQIYWIDSSDWKDNELFLHENITRIRRKCHRWWTLSTVQALLLQTR